MRVLLTGAAGFIGHHVLSYLLDKTDWNIVALVKMDKVGDLRRIEEACPNRARCKIVWVDLRSPVPEYLGDFDLILHFGAETHVDDSIANPMSFVQSNVTGTTHLLEFLESISGGSSCIFRLTKFSGLLLKESCFSRMILTIPTIPTRRRSRLPSSL